MRSLTLTSWFAATRASRSDSRDASHDPSYSSSVYFPGKSPQLRHHLSSIEDCTRRAYTETNKRRKGVHLYF
jgi:hypothetical protein